jgi:hypothetical protein
MRRASTWRAAPEHDEIEDRGKRSERRPSPALGRLDSTGACLAKNTDGRTADKTQKEESRMAQSNDTSNRGFASMDEEKQRQIASEGGRAAHEKGTAHEFTPEEAREAGKKGGEAVSRDREHMSEIGSEGGKARGGDTSGTRGGTSEQHAEAGRQSHKNE